MPDRIIDTCFADKCHEYIDFKLSSTESPAWEQDLKELYAEKWLPCNFTCCIAS
jgi:hypothetical protein